MTLSDDEFGRRAEAVREHVTTALDVNSNDVAVSSRPDGLLDADIPRSSVLTAETLHAVMEPSSCVVEGHQYSVTFERLELAFRHVVCRVES